VDDLAPPHGRVVRVGAAPGDTAEGPRRLEQGRLSLDLVVDGLPIGELPTGARLRIGATVMVELDRGARHPPDEAGGLREAGQTDSVPADVLEGGVIAPGDTVTLEAVTVPLTDVLDLHSFRPGDAPGALVEYLAEARRAGFREVRIVHGRGRGVQRATVRRLLAETPGVAGFADAPPTRGGWGATVVHLGRSEEDAPSE
jgi:hypothetical protein